MCVQAPEGAANFRDLGGWPTQDGGRVRSGLIYRSGELEGLTEAGWKRLIELNIRTIFDLRGGGEEPPSGRNPAELGLVVRHLPIWGTDGPRETLAGPDPSDDGDGRRDVVAAYAEAKVESYRHMVTAFATELGAVITGLADPNAKPALIHCAAGKDRTGLAVALVLLTVGVSQTDVTADYLISRITVAASRRERYLPMIRARGGNEATFARVYGGYPPALHAALTLARERWGSVEDYLTGPAGVAPDDLINLRNQLIEYS